MQVHVRHPESHQAPPGYLVVLALICCLPTAVIAVVLLSSGGTRVGILVPALGAGAMIGLLMFAAFSEPTGR